MDAFFLQVGSSCCYSGSVSGLCWSSLASRTLSEFPKITGRYLQEVARAKKSAAGGLDGWAWNEIKALPLPWFSGLAIFLNLVESSGTWPQGLLDIDIAMIPEADGDSTPLGQRMIILP